MRSFEYERNIFNDHRIFFKGIYVSRTLSHIRFSKCYISFMLRTVRSIHSNLPRKLLDVRKEYEKFPRTHHSRSFELFLMQYSTMYRPRCTHILMEIHITLLIWKIKMNIWWQLFFFIKKSCIARYKYLLSQKIIHYLLKKNLKNRAQLSNYFLLTPM